jgi:hypothetical protein
MTDDRRRKMETGLRPLILSAVVRLAAVCTWRQIVSSAALKRKKARRPRGRRGDAVFETGSRRNSGLRHLH